MTSMQQEKNTPKVLLLFEEGQTDERDGLTRRRHSFRHHTQEEDDRQKNRDLCEVLPHEEKALTESDLLTGIRGQSEAEDSHQ